MSVQASRRILGVLLAVLTVFGVIASITGPPAHAISVVSVLSIPAGSEGGGYSAAVDTQTGDLVIADYSGGVVDVHGTQITHQVADADLPIAAAYDPDSGDVYILDSINPAIRTYDPATGVLSSPDYLASIYLNGGGYSAAYLIYNPVDGMIDAVFRGVGNQNVLAMRWNPADGMIDGIIQIAVSPTQGQYNANVYGVAVNPDSGILYIEAQGGSQGNTPGIYTANFANDLPGGPYIPAGGINPQGGVNQLTNSPDGSSLYVGGIGELYRLNYATNTWGTITLPSTAYTYAIGSDSTAAYVVGGLLATVTGNPPTATSVGISTPNALNVESDPTLNYLYTFNGTGLLILSMTSSAPAAVSITSVTGPAFQGAITGYPHQATGSLQVAVSNPVANPITSGWHISLSTEAFTCTSGLCATSGTSSSLGAVSVTAANTVCSGSGCSPPSNTVTYPVTLPNTNTPVAILDASSSSGEGDQTATFAVDVTIPSSALAGNYTATWTLTAATGP